MPKNKSHKGLLKRVRVTKSGKIKMHRAFGRHLRSHKSGQSIRRYRRPIFAAGADARRLRSLLRQKVSRKRSGAVTQPVEAAAADSLD